MNGMSRASAKMKTSDATMLMGDCREDRNTPANLVRDSPEEEGRRHRAGEIDGVDQCQRDLREMKLVAVHDVERRRQCGAHEQERQYEGGGIALRALAQTPRGVAATGVSCLG
jgi:hypothetical protein